MSLHPEEKEAKSRDHKYCGSRCRYTPIVVSLGIQSHQHKIKTIGVCSGTFCSYKYLVTRRLSDGSVVPTGEIVTCGNAVMRQGTDGSSNSYKYCVEHCTSPIRRSVCPNAPRIGDDEATSSTRCGRIGCTLRRHTH